MSGMHVPAGVERRVTLRARKGRISSAMPLGYQWLHLGEVPPDQQCRSDRQFPSDPAIGSVVTYSAKWGPKAVSPAFVVLGRSQRAR